MRQWIAIGAAVGLVAVSLPYVRSHDAQIAEMLSKGKAHVGGAALVKQVAPPPLADLDLTKIDDRGGLATAPAHGDRKAELTLSTKYQRAAMAELRAGHVPEGAIVMTDVKTGKVLVWASVVEDGPVRDIAAEATAPSASVFKIITGTTLIENGVGPGTRQCYSGGEHQLRAIDLVDDKKRDKWCATMTQALGRSLNTVFARLAQKHLDRDKIRAVASRYGYTQDLPFDVKIAPSTLAFPDDDLGFARTAAGFWHSTLSPFEGANIATTIANGGEMIRLYVVEDVKDETGDIYRAQSGRQVVRRVIDEGVASQVTTMMENTVESGTSYRSFHDRNGHAYLPDIRHAHQALRRRPVLHVVRGLRAEPQAGGRHQRHGREPPQVAREGDQHRRQHAAHVLRRQGRARRQGPGRPRRDRPALISRSARLRFRARHVARLEAAPAARLVRLDAADQHRGRLGDEALRSARGRAADRADGVHLGHLFRDGHELGHRREGAPQVVLVEARRDDAHAAVGEPLAHLDDAAVEELRLVDGDDLGLLVDARLQALARGDRDGVHAHGLVRDDARGVVAVVDARLERLDALPGEERALEAPDELLGLAAEHGARDHLDGAALRRPAVGPRSGS
jgi:hypothetical protein